MGQKLSEKKTERFPWQQHGLHQSTSRELSDASLKSTGLFPQVLDCVLPNPGARSPAEWPPRNAACSLLQENGMNASRPA